MNDRLDVREEAISWESLDAPGFEFAGVTQAYVSGPLPDDEQYVAFVLYDGGNPKALAYVWNVDKLGDITAGMLLEIACYESVDEESREQLVSWLEEHFVLAFSDDYSDWASDRGYFYPRPSAVEGYVFVNREHALRYDLLMYIIGHDRIRGSLEDRGLGRYAAQLSDFLLEAFVYAEEKPA